MIRWVSAFLPAIHLHAVVAQEMIAGAMDARRENLIHESLVKPFERRRRVVTPSFATWKRAGSIMAHLVQKKMMAPGGFSRSFVDDCLLAASCRDEGLVLITANASDFALIKRVEEVEVVGPWP
jgi:predicted nucleic acid-binding protein